MKIGCIGYANNTGLGNYIANFRTHLPLSSQLVIRHPDKGTYLPPCDYSMGSILATEGELIEYLDKFSPDIVMIIETPFNEGFFSILKSRGIKIVFVPMIDCRSLSSFSPHFSQIDLVINHTKFGHNIYHSHLGDKARYLPYPVDTEYFSPESIKGFASYTFLHNQGTGGAGYRKATDQVFVAFRQLQYATPASEGVSLLVNSQPYEEIKGQLSKGVKHATVRVQDFPSAIDLYRNGKIYVAPSRREGLGLPILEAMSCGLPVITTNAPPMNEWIRDPAILVDVTREEDLPYGDIPMYTPNPFDLMMKMEYALSHPKHMERIGVQNRCVVEENCSWKVLHNKYIALFEELR